MFLMFRRVCLKYRLFCLYPAAQSSCEANMWFDIGSSGGTRRASSWWSVQIGAVASQPEDRRGSRRSP